MNSNEDFTESGVPRLPLSLRFLFFLLRILRRPAFRKDGTLNRRLSDLFDFKAPAQERPVRGISSKDVVVDKGTGVWVRIYIPHKEPNRASSTERETTKERVPVILYFHGGGFATLRANFTYYDAFCSRLCRDCTAVVISVDYRRSPEHRYPIPNEDCFSALKWLKGEGKEHIPSRADISRCFLMGDSAGGNIVHHVACMAGAGKGDLSPLKVIGSLLLFPFFGGEERTAVELRLKDPPIGNLREYDWYWQAYLPEGSNRDHPGANVVGPNAPGVSNLELAPCMVVIAEFDILKDRQIAYCRELKHSGKEVQMEYYKGGFHSFHIFLQLDMASRLMKTVQDFMETRLKIADESGSPFVQTLIHDIRS